MNTVMQVHLQINTYFLTLYISPSNLKMLQQGSALESFTAFIVDLTDRGTRDFLCGTCGTLVYWRGGASIQVHSRTVEKVQIIFLCPSAPLRESVSDGAEAFFQCTADKG